MTSSHPETRRPHIMTSDILIVLSHILTTSRVPVTSSHHHHHHEVWHPHIMGSDTTMRPHAQSAEAVALASASAASASAYAAATANGSHAGGGGGHGGHAGGGQGGGGGGGGGWQPDVQAGAGAGSAGKRSPSSAGLDLNHADSVRVFNLPLDARGRAGSDPRHNSTPLSKHYLNSPNGTAARPGIGNLNSSSNNSNNNLNGSSRLGPAGPETQMAMTHQGSEDVGAFASGSPQVRGLGAAAKSKRVAGQFVLGMRYSVQSVLGKCLIWQCLE